MIIIGLDYSITSPAACFIDTVRPDYANAGFMFMTSTVSLAKSWDIGAALCQGKLHPEWKSEMERYNNIAVTFAMPFLNQEEGFKFYIEGYSMGSQGRVFHIAENMAVFKYILFVNNVPYEVISPSSIKKFATGKGNADKSKMYGKFLEETGVNLVEKMVPKRHALASPVTDLVDAYYIAKFGVENERLLSASKQPSP